MTSMRVNVGETDWLVHSFLRSSVDTSWVRWMVCPTCGDLRPIPGGDEVSPRSGKTRRECTVSSCIRSPLLLLPPDLEEASWACIRLGGREALEAMFNGQPVPR